MGGYLPLIRKDSTTDMYGFAIHVMEGLPFVRDLSLKNSADSYLCFRLVLLSTFRLALLLFRLSITFFVFMHGF